MGLKEQLYFYLYSQKTLTSKPMRFIVQNKSAKLAQTYWLLIKTEMVFLQYSLRPELFMALTDFFILCSTLRSRSNACKTTWIIYLEGSFVLNRPVLFFISTTRNCILKALKCITMAKNAAYSPLSEKKIQKLSLGYLLFKRYTLVPYLP